MTTVRGHERLTVFRQAAVFVMTGGHLGLLASLVT